MAVLAIPHEFFIKERQMYSDWRTAILRELIQNSTDPNAGSTQIFINISTENGITHIQFNDNGSGMTREILEDVYFKLGATTKNSGNSMVGGFGRARILTCFSMKRYEIRTNLSYVIGEGAVYDIFDIDQVNGCNIDVYLNESEATAEQMIEACNEYLTYSRLNCQVFVNGVEWNAWLYKGRLSRELIDNDGGVFAHIYVSKSEHSVNLKNMVVRVNGTMMFRRSISPSASVIVEIIPELSRKVLVANRDQINHRYQDALNTFLDEIAIDSTSALDTAIRRKSTIIRSNRGGSCTVRDNRHTKDINSNDIATFVALSPKIAAFVPTEKSSFSREITDHTKSESTSDIMTFDVHIEDDTDINDIAIRDVIDNYNPQNWGLRGNIYIGANKQKLLFIWFIICRSVCEHLCDHLNTNRFKFTVGWTFGKNEASCKDENNIHVFLLNPVNKDGSMKFSIRDKKNLRRMIAYACHEVAHTEFSYHNEEFSGLMTELVARVEEKEIMRLVFDYLKGD